MIYRTDQETDKIQNRILVTRGFGFLFTHQLMLFLIQERFVHRIIHKTHQQHPAHQIAERDRDQIVKDALERDRSRVVQHHVFIIDR